MRQLVFDPFEFGGGGSEETLGLAISSRRQHPELADFLKDCGASSVSGDSPPADWWRWGEVAAHFRRFAHLVLPPMQECVVVVISDSWDDLEMAVTFEQQLLWYHWFTTA